MILKLLGIMDIIAAIAMVLAHYGLGLSFGLVFAIYLLIKGVAFLPSFVSIMDLICGLFLFLSLVDVNFFFYWVFVLWLLQKGFFSLFS